MDKVKFTRAQLFDLVWKYPISQITKEYNVSSFGLKNACERMEIPLPRPSFLLKANFKKALVPQLSQSYKGSDAIEIEPKGYKVKIRVIAKSSPLQDLVQSIRSDRNAPLQVGDVLVDPSPVIVRTQTYYDLENRNMQNMEDFRSILNLNVSSENIPRALLFMDALIKLLAYRGHRFDKGLYNTDTVFFSNGIEIDVNLREASRRVQTANLDSSNYLPTGRFILRIGKDLTKKEWKDTRKPLENYLAAIVAELEIMAQEEKQWKDSGESKVVKKIKAVK
ncbi:hypothetical protein GKZ90_0005390 [Flavobacterium sp. MC2016-06]|jgi:hypothetical protein|uniref:hypothetical protein n=1 Tax=Flavobacterium sp. MC2016-06 TaxID=2676308 RepID=UPI0012BA84B9|nr:hypothetical protein [Flavobacterium sp. MC2016-06]MBU3857570.1 hypothetical protein [Flavobacterium sp. MC2016-06]